MTALLLSPLPSIHRLLANKQFTEQELGLMISLQPMTPDEVFRLIPSLDVSWTPETCMSDTCTGFAKGVGQGGGVLRADQTCTRRTGSPERWSSGPGN